jgi:PhnB protein
MARFLPVLNGHPMVSPYLIVRGARAAIPFYEAALGAVETLRLETPDGMVGYAELTLGDSQIMLADENPAWGSKGPEAFGGSPVSFNVMVGDVDAAVERAVAAGATVQKEVSDQFHGHRSGTVADPYGYSWSLSSRTEDLSNDDLRSRWNAMLEQQTAAAP